jgi:hypothetical protein
MNKSAFALAGSVAFFMNNASAKCEAAVDVHSIVSIEKCEAIYLPRRGVPPPGVPQQLRPSLVLDIVVKQSEARYMGETIVNGPSWRPDQKYQVLLYWGQHEKILSCDPKLPKEATIITAPPCCDTFPPSDICSTGMSHVIIIR